MDVVPNDPSANLASILQHVENAASVGADYVVFPECALTGYCFDSPAEAAAAAISPEHDCFNELAAASQEFEIAISVGSLLLEPASDKRSGNAAENGETVIRNSVLTFHNGECIDIYHKIHLPFLGVDRFVKPGDQLHKPIDIDGLKVGIHICYEGGFPEVARSLSLAGADLVILPTNWPPGSGVSWQAIPACRALENRVYFMAVNRIGAERETSFIGQSSICDVTGQVIGSAEHDLSAMMLATIDVELARKKKLVLIPGKYEVDRIGDRRPDLYSRLTDSE